MRTFMLAVTGLAFGIAGCSSYGTSVVEKTRAQVASVSVAVPTSLVAGQSARAVATPKDANGTPLIDRPVTWFSSSASIAIVSDSGVVSAVAPGTAVVSAVAEGVAGQASMAVMPPSPTPIATLLVSLSPSAVLVGQTAHATATLEDSSGNLLSGRVVTWESSNVGVATVQATGDVKAVASGSAMIKATSEGKTASSSLSVSAPAPVPVATVSVSPSSASLLVGGSQQLSAVTRDANNNVLTGRVVTWSSSNPALSSVSASGLVTALAAGGATITATSETKTGTSAITATIPTGGGAGWRGNEPAGMTQISDRPFNAVVEGSWDPYGSDAFTIVSDATAPQSPSNVIRATYPAGFAAGQAPAFTTLPHTQFAKIYICFAVKLSSNWVGNGSGVNKMMYEWTTVPHPSFFFGAYGTGGSTLQPEAMLQDIVSHGGGVFFGPNLVPSAQIIRGKWQQIEIFIQGNSSGTADGTVDWYLDGIHVGSVGGIQWTSGATTFDTFQFYPIWGGGNTSPAITATQTMDWDHVYISGKN